MAWTSLTIKTIISGRDTQLRNMDDHLLHSAQRPASPQSGIGAGALMIEGEREIERRGEHLSPRCSFAPPRNNSFLCPKVEGLVNRFALCSSQFFCVYPIHPRILFLHSPTSLPSATTFASDRLTSHARICVR